MSHVGLASIAAGAGIALVYLLWHSFAERTRKSIATAAVEKEMERIMARAQAEIDALADPERKHTEGEVNAELDRIRARGREPK